LKAITMIVTTRLLSVDRFNNFIACLPPETDTSNATMIILGPRSSNGRNHPVTSVDVVEN